MVTIEQVRASQFAVICDRDGHPVAVSVGRCADVPGLGFVDLTSRRDGTVSRIWMVGDEPYESLEAAVAAVNGGEAVR